MLSLIAATSTIAEIRAWIQSGEADRIRLRIVETGLDVQIEKTRHRQIRYHNIWSSMPPETHSIEDNPLYELLKRKLDQLTGGQPETFRCIFLADVGSTLLRRVGRDGEIDSTRRRVSGREIISHFVSAYADRIDSVVVFAPYREGLFMGQTRFRYALGDRDGEKSLVGHCLNSRHDLIERYRRVCGPGCRRPRSACARASIQAEGAWVGKRIHAIVLRQSGVSNFRDQCVQFPQE